MPKSNAENEFDIYFESQIKHSYQALSNSHYAQPRATYVNI